MQSNRGIRLQSGFVDPLDLPACWPQGVPLLLLGGTSRFAVLPIEFERSDFAGWLSQPLAGCELPPGQGECGDTGIPFISGYIAALSYDDLRELVTGGRGINPSSRVFRVYRALVFDCRDRKVWETWEDQPDSRANTETPAVKWVVPETAWRPWLEGVGVVSNSSMLPPAFSLSDGFGQDWEACQKGYLNVVRQVLADIRNGRFYQANILRFFKAEGASLRHLAARIRRYGGPWSALITDGDLVIASFSPERFVLVEPLGSGASKYLRAVAEPIKGTAGRSPEAATDAELAKALAASVKDRAELHMIVDLLRNDLHRISVPGSVRVESSGEIHTFSHVHHLVAKVTSRLQSSLRVCEFLKALCPGGSITGAPKTEVMKAIREYEGCERGFFMGHVVLHDRSGRLDSSILIRTLLSQDGGNTFDFAAGSGIVIGSSPDLELAEITAKCRVVTAPVS